MQNTLEPGQSAAAWVAKNWPRFVRKPEELPSWNRSDLEAPRITGVYFLWSEEGGLLYIGRTTDVSYRIAQHHWAEIIPFDWYSVLELDLEPCLLEFALPAFEASYIRGLIPPHNYRWTQAAIGPAGRMHEAIEQAWKHAEREPA